MSEKLRVGILGATGMEMCIRDSYYISSLQEGVETPYIIEEEQLM